MQSFNNVDDARTHGQIAHVPSFRILLPVLVALATLGSLHADPLDHWTQRVPGTNAHLSAVAYGAGRFVAVGQGGVRLSSSNGTDWAVAPAGLETNFHSVAHGAGLFVAVGAGGTVHTSADGVNWVARDSNTTNGLLCVRWAKDRFLASGGLGTLLSSTNGVDWQAWDSGTPNQLTGIAYGAGMFMVVGRWTSSNSFTVLRSTDGETWSGESVRYGDFYDLIHHDDRFVGLCLRGFVQVSTNGQGWSLGFSANYNYALAITHVHGRFLAVGAPDAYSGNQKIVSSPDGLTWKLHPGAFNHSGTLRGVALGNNTAVAVGDSGLIIQSDSLFRLHAGTTLPGGGREWVLHGEAGRPYRFQYSSELNGSWLDLTNFLSTNDVITLRDPLPPSPTNRFYRVVTP